MLGRDRKGGVLMKLVNMVKERGYENTIEDAIRIAAPLLNDGKNIKEILDEWNHKGIVSPEIYQYFEIKLETAALIMKIERLFAEFGHTVYGIIYLLDRTKRCDVTYGSVHYIAAPHLGEDIIRNMTAFDIGPTKGLCGKAIYEDNIYVSNHLANEDCFTEEQLYLFEKYNLNSAVSVPIVVDGIVVATVALMSNEKIGNLQYALKKRLINKIHSLESTFDRLQHQWKSIRKIEISSIHDKTGVVKYIDSNIEYCLGIHPSDIIGRNRSLDLVVEEDKIYRHMAFERAIKEKRPESIVYRLNSPVGEVMVETTFTPIFNKDGSLRYVQSITKTNTLRCKEFERDLKNIKECVK
jgi:PAS domain-containing protein